MGKIKQRYIFPISVSYEAIKLLSRLPQALMTHTFDATWLNRTFYNAVNLELLIKKPLIFDIDDAIWINNEKHVSTIAKKSALVLAGNDYIANWATTYNKNVMVLPTAIDTEVYIKATAKKRIGFNIGWTGTSDNLKFLYTIEDALKPLLEKHSDIRLIVMSDKAPEFKKLNAKQVEWVKWSVEKEVTTIQKFDIGLMPLEDTDWAKGKCSFKMLQYMSVSIPVVVSPVGMNTDVFKKGDIGFLAKNNKEWTEAIEAFYNDENLLTHTGSNARRVIEEFYSTKKITAQLVKAFNNTF